MALDDRHRGARKGRPTSVTPYLVIAYRAVVSLISAWYMSVSIRLLSQGFAHVEAL